MTLLTIKEACKVSGKSAKTIYRHISNGKLSASKNVDGQYQFDVAELSRAYGGLRVSCDDETTHLTKMRKSETPVTTADTTYNSSVNDKLTTNLESEVAFLRGRVLHLEAMLEKAQSRNFTLALGHKTKFSFWDFFRRKEPATES